MANRFALPTGEESRQLGLKLDIESLPNFLALIRNAIVRARTPGET